jgi:hypothetical protein
MAALISSVADSAGEHPCRGLDLDLVQVGDAGHIQALREHRRDHAHRGVGGGHAGEDQVEAQPLDGPGQDQGGAQRVGAGDTLVADVDRPVTAHRQGLAQGALGFVGADGQISDLGVDPGFDDPQGLLDRVLVQLGQQRVDRLAVGGAVRLEPAVGGGVGDVLHADDDLHGGLRSLGS